MKFVYRKHYKFYRLFAIVSLALCIFQAGLFAENWDDLDEPIPTSREAEGRYTFNLLYIIYYENWQNRNGQIQKSSRVLPFYDSVSYPKYSSLNLYPFLYFHKHSLIDKRSRTVWFPFFYSKMSADGKESGFYTLLFGQSRWGDETSSYYTLLYNYKKQSTNHNEWGLFPLYNYTANQTKSEHNYLLNFASFYDHNIKDGKPTDSGSYFFPLYANRNYTDQDGKHHTNFSAIHYWRNDEDKKEKTRWFLPLLAYYNTNPKQTSWTAALLLGGSKRNEDSINNATNASDDANSGGQKKLDNTTGNEATNSFYFFPLYNYTDTKTKSEHNYLLNFASFYDHNIKNGKPTDSGSYFFPLYANRNYTDQDGKHHTNFSAIHYWRNDEDKKEKTRWFLPLLAYYNTNPKQTSWTAALLLGGSKRNEDNINNATNASDDANSGEQKKLDNTTGNEAANSFYFFPLYSYTDTKTKSEHNYLLGFGSFYDHDIKDGKPTDSGSYFFPLYANRNWSDKNGKHHTNFSAIHYWRNDEGKNEKTRWFLPLLAYYNTNPKQTSWMAALLLGGSKRNDADTTDEANNTNTAGNKPNEATSSFYFFPLYSYTDTKTKSEHNYLLGFGSFYDHDIKDGKPADTGSYFFPLYANRNWSDKNGKHHTNFSAIHYWRNDEDKKEKTRWFLPLLAYYNTNPKQTSWTAALLLGGSKRNDADTTDEANNTNTAGNKPNEATSSFYFFPLYSYTDTKTKSEHNYLLGFGSFYDHDIKDGKPTDSGSYFFPLYANRNWSDKNGKHHTNFSAIHYWRNDEDKKEKTRWFLPLLAYYNTNPKQTSWTTALLLGGSKRNDADTTGDADNERYDASDAEQKKLDTAAGNTAGNKPNEATSSFYFFPLYSYTDTKTKSEHNYLLGFGSFYDHDIKDGKPTDSGSYFFPVYANRNYTDQDGKHHTNFSAIHYWRNDEDKKEKTRLIWPIGYYSHNWIEDDHSYNTDWFLIYYNWNHKESEGNLTLPFYYRYKDDDKEWELYALGAVTTTGVMLEAKEGSLYLDVDAYYGYGLFGTSHRLPIFDRNIFSKWQRQGNDKVRIVGETEENTEVAADEAQTPHVHQSHLESFDRENTKNYEKWSVLFGWITKIKADNRHHFRFLPLAWLSWDDSNKNEYLTYWPFAYLDYHSPEEQYKAVFPLFIPVYGRYTKGKDETVSWGGPFYIRSFKEENNDHDLYAPWPFFNTYSSDTLSGTRLFPLFAKRWWVDEEGSHDRLITPVWYRHSLTKDDRTETTSFSLLHYSSSSVNTNDQSAIQSSEFYLPLLLSRSSAQNSSSWNAAFLFGGSRKDDKSSWYAFPLYRYNASQTISEHNYLLGFGSFYDHDIKDGKPADTGSYFFPLYANRNYTDQDGKHHTNFSAIHYWRNDEDKKEKTRWFLPLLAYYNTNPKQTSWTAALLLGGSKRNDAADTTDEVNNTNTTGNKPNEATSSFYFFPLYSYTDTKTKSEHNYLLNFASFYDHDIKDGKPADTGSYFFPLYANRNWSDKNGKHHTNFSAIHYWRNDEDKKEKTRWFLPLLAYYNTNPKQTSWTAALLLGGSKRNEGSINNATNANDDANSGGQKKLDNTADNEATSSFYLFPLYSYTDTKTKSEHNYLLNFASFYDHDIKDGKPADTGSYFFPLYANRNWSDKNGKHHTNFSAIHYWRNDEDEGKKTRWFLPLLTYYESSSKEAKWNTALLFGGSSKEYESSWYAFPLYDGYTTSKGSYEHDILFGIGSVYRFNDSRNQTDTGSYLFPVYANRSWISQNGKEHYTNFSLLHYWHTSDEEKTRLILPLLYYSNTTDRNDVATWGFGILYYRKADQARFDQGVLWGLLFEDVKEPKYKSWSILQGAIYSNVENDRDGIYYRRILGLQIKKDATDRMD